MQFRKDRIYLKLHQKLSNAPEDDELKCLNLSQIVLYLHQIWLEKFREIKSSALVWRNNDVSMHAQLNYVKDVN